MSQIVQMEVPAEQMADVVEVAASRNTPIALTCMVRQVWRNYRSRFLGMRGDEVWIEYPSAEQGRPVPEMVPEQKLGLAFKQRHHKFVFTSTVLRVADFDLSPTVTVRGVQIAWPKTIRRLQRRAFYRVNIPSDKPVFTEFWEGGLAKEPPEHLRENLVFHGKLDDISAGGCRARLTEDREIAFHAGDALGMRLKFRNGQEPIEVDGLFRHAASDEFGPWLGVQFAGLNETAQGRRALNQITDAVAEFQRIELRRSRTGAKEAFGQH